jgi:tRNA (guanine-N7-)-methyltransferase
MSETPGPQRRRIRSYVLRGGRITVAQERALATLWPRFGLELKGAPLDLDAAFGRRAPRTLEIGFGTGEVLARLAAAHPEIDHLGIEVHRAGIGRLLLEAERLDLANLRIVCHDAVEVLERTRPESFDLILVFFPDPWHKKRHHKRRLIDETFVARLAEVLRPDGVLRLATDWQDYAEQMRRVCDACPSLRSLADAGGYVARPDFRPPTRFERRGERLGHPVWDLAYRKRPHPDGRSSGKYPKNLTSWPSIPCC